MSEKTNLSNLELQVTQKIQLQFPRGEISSEVLKFWDSCPAEVLKAKILEAFGAVPVSVGNIDTIIRVYRTAPPIYPPWVTEVVHKDLELTGPTEFDISRISQFFHPEQSTVITGNKIYQYMIDNDMLKDQLGWSDLLAIQAKGIDFFKKNFMGQAVFAWKSVVQDRDGILRVPCLVEGARAVIVSWRWLDDGRRSDSPALYFVALAKYEKDNVRFPNGKLAVRDLDC